MTLNENWIKKIVFFPLQNLTYACISCFKFDIAHICIQIFSLNRPHLADSVIESPCPSVCLSVCAIKSQGEVPGEQTSLPLFLMPLIGPQVT